MSHFIASRTASRILPLMAAVGLAVTASAVYAQDTKAPAPAPDKATVQTPEKTPTQTPEKATAETPAKAPEKAPAAASTAAPVTKASLPSTEADDIKPPTDPVARAAFDALKKNCSRCHQAGKYLTARSKPAKDFGFILKLDELAANPHYVKPGLPNASLIYKQITDNEMPYDLNYEGAIEPEITKADIKAIETWIVSLGQKQVASCSDHKFVSDTDVVSMIAADLGKLSEVRAKNTRYLTLVHLANSCTSAEAMKVYRQAAVKLINSLSRSSDVVRLETIDPDKAIIRINLEDIGWEASDWDTLLASYPYNMVPDTPLMAVLKTTTGTALPYARADWFASTAAQPPLYYTLLKLPKTFAELTKQQGVDVKADIEKFIAKRAGFQKSGVSQNNRLIERHPIRTGYFWTSYDFSENRGHQSLFEFPLGPGGKNGFHHAGGETIFSLPNGFQAYYLNKSTGKRLDTGPTSIVQDRSRKDLAVTNGISCMGCHDQGMRKAKDDIRDFVLTGRAFSKKVRDTVAELYPPHDEMDKVIATDAKRFANAMTSAGLDPTLKLDGVEMINALAKRYDENIDIARAAAEFGMTEKQLKEAAADASRKLRPNFRRLEQGFFPRDQFETVFRELAQDITDNKFVTTAVAAAKPTTPKATPVKHVASLADLSLTSNKDTYKQGDTPSFTVVSPKDCFLTLTDIDDKGQGTVLLPNKFQQNNFIKAGVPVTFPGPHAPFKYMMNDKGVVEKVVAVCSERKVIVDGIKHNFKKTAFTSVKNYSDSVARSVVAHTRQIIVVKEKEAKTASKKDEKPKAVSESKRFSGRTAIKIRVE